MVASQSGRAVPLLLVEDNPADARIFQEMLRDAGRFAISWVKTIAAAEASLAGHDFALCVLDLNLPDGEGVQLVERLLAHPTMPPIVVLSGQSQADLEIARAAVQTGAQDYLPKDRLDEDTLYRALTMAIERHRLLQVLGLRERELEEAQKLARVGDWHWPLGVALGQLSQEVYRQLGVHPALFEANFRNIVRCLRPASRRALCQAIRRSMAASTSPAANPEGKPAIEVVVQINQPGGVLLDVRVELCTRRNAQGAVTAFYGIAQDVTALQAAERVKNEFVSVVSHELRTPLTSILGSLKLVLANSLGDVPAPQAQLLGIALSNGERLLALINDLLDIEKIESGNMSFDLKPIAVSDLLVQAVEQNRPYAQQFNVGLQMQDEAAGAVVHADGKRFGQLLSNLISNAVKFSPDGGTVSVAVAIEAAWVRFSVRDQGAGIPLAFQSQIFKKFAQADSSDQRRHQGTGLGLSIVKLIAERHQGVCHFASTPGEGTVFHVDLPALNTDKTDHSATCDTMTAHAC